MKKLCFGIIAVVALSVPQAAALQTEEVLDLVAMPLAVAAVSEVTGVPTQSLISLVAALNDVSVPPPQFVEIVRYSPVLLVDPSLEPQVITFVTNEVDRGITHEELVLALQNQIRANGIDRFEIVEQPRRVVLDRRTIVPDVVVQRAEVIRNHPHGGPPGQIKKQIGVQTGAEVVHGTDPQRDRGTIRVEREDGRGDRDRPVAKQNEGRGGPPAHAKQGKDKDGPPAKAGKGKPNKDDNPGKGNSKGKGKNRGDR